MIVHQCTHTIFNRRTDPHKQLSFSSLRQRPPHTHLERFFRTGLPVTALSLPSPSSPQHLLHDLPLRRRVLVVVNQALPAHLFQLPQPVSDRARRVRVRRRRKPHGRYDPQLALSSGTRRKPILRPSLLKPACTCSVSPSPRARTRGVKHLASPNLFSGAQTGCVATRKTYFVNA